MGHKERLQLVIADYRPDLGVLVLEWRNGEIAIHLPPDGREMRRDQLSTEAKPALSVRDMWRQTFGTFDGLPLEAILDFSDETVRAEYVVLADGMPVSLPLSVHDALGLAAQFGNPIWGTGLTGAACQQMAPWSFTLAPADMAILGRLERALSGRSS